MFVTRNDGRAQLFARQPPAWLPFVYDFATVVRSAIRTVTCARPTTPRGFRFAVRDAFPVRLFVVRGQRTSPDRTNKTTTPSRPFFRIFRAAVALSPSTTDAR